jgi:hypothetical protein
MEHRPYCDFQRGAFPPISILGLDQSHAFLKGLYAPLLFRSGEMEQVPNGRLVYAVEERIVNQGHYKGLSMAPTIAVMDGIEKFRCPQEPGFILWQNGVTSYCVLGSDRDGRVVAIEVRRSESALTKQRVIKTIDSLFLPQLIH